MPAAQLKRGDVAVEGHWWTSAGSNWSGSFVARFEPSVPLSLGTDYALVLTSAIRGAQGGQPLAGNVVIPFTTETRAPGPSDVVLAVRSFSIIEEQVAGDTSVRVYAPRLQLAETGGKSSATVFKMTFTIPGFQSPFDICSPGTTVFADSSMEMFDEVRYGDYAWQLAASVAGSGVRATPGEASATILYRDDAGRTDTLTAHGAVTPGGPPPVYFEGPAHQYYYGGPNNGSNCVPLNAPSTASKSAAAPSSRAGRVYAAQGDDVDAKAMNGRSLVRATCGLIVATSLALACSGTEGPSSIGRKAVLTVQSFSMVEYQSQGDTGRYNYAPQLVLAASGGGSAATVTAMLLSLPGFSTLGSVCSTGTMVPAGQSAVMFSELYGDYEVSYTIDHPVAAGQATATIIFRDDIGRVDTLLAAGPVVPGSMPTTNTSGNGHGYGDCQHVLSGTAAPASSATGAPRAPASQ